MKIAIVQRVIKSYRIPVYKKLSNYHDITFIYGDDISNSKSKSCKLNNINALKCKTTHISFLNRTFTIHWDLITKIKNYNPDCILLEGESHIIGNIQIFLYQQLFNRRVGIMKWCFIDLPGDERHGFRYILKFLVQRLFDVFVLYSTASKRYLKRYKVNEKRGFVTVNVSNVEYFLNKYNNTFITKSSARYRLKLKNIFTVLFVGNFEKQKKFTKFLEVAKNCIDQDMQFIVAGGGINKEYYMALADEKKLHNVHFLGQVNDISNVYYASDVVYIPGRGGMIISEALCFAVPVILHYADGTESDLIENQNSGYILDESTEIVSETIKSLSKDPDKIKLMGSNGQNLIKLKYNTENMANQILNAGYYSIMLRKNAGF